MTFIKRTAILLELALTVFITSCTCTDTELEMAAMENFTVPLFPSESVSESEPTEPEVTEELVEEPADGLVIGVDILTYEETFPLVKEAIINRETLFTADVEVMEDDVNTVLKRIYDDVIAPTGVPTEGDYIFMNIRDINLQEMRTLYSGARPYVHYDFTLQYHTTKSEEAEVGQRINEILLELGVYDMPNDIDRVTAIYQWITTNVSYDEDHIGDQSYLPQYSAYGALFNGTAVCQGCCSLLYRMLLTAGIDCRCVIGFANGDSHAWNIIDVDGIWYNTDVTWDLGEYPGTYDYFLKGSASFDETHFRNEPYSTEDFCNAYPVPVTDYEY